LKINKRKFIYLISPNKITKNFYKNLKLVFKTGKVSFFQLRLKNYSLKEKIIIGRKIKNICRKNRVKFLINDDPLLALKLDADGCHLGQNDMDIIKAKKILGNKIIGITCHNSINLAKKAIKANANYIAFGAFYSTKTKKTKYLASTNILNKVKKFTKTPIVAIGGINYDNYKNLLLKNANFLAISSYIWKNKKYKPLQALERLK
jgi:thiamine-phosphate pyrophosphorylase